MVYFPTFFARASEGFALSRVQSLAQDRIACEYREIHENHKNSTIHVGKYTTSPMDAMGFGDDKPLPMNKMVKLVN